MSVLQCVTFFLLAKQNKGGTMDGLGQACIGWRLAKWNAWTMLTVVMKRQEMDYNDSMAAYEGSGNIATLATTKQGLIL